MFTYYVNIALTAKCRTKNKCIIIETCEKVNRNERVSIYEDNFLTFTYLTSMNFTASFYWATRVTLKGRNWNLLFLIFDLQFCKGFFCNFWWFIFNITNITFEDFWNLKSTGKDLLFFFFCSINWAKSIGWHIFCIINKIQLDYPNVFEVWWKPFGNTDCRSFEQSSRLN